MDKTDIYEKLNGLFVADLMGRIIPGTIHNLANPIGGIMGRVQLMQTRIAKSFEKIESLYPELYREIALDKIRKDVAILAGESATLLSIFKNFDGKILALSARGQEMINVAKMIEAEINFADFYLDFKHDINKTVTFSDNVPSLFGERDGYSLCISSLINSARQRMEAAPEKEFAVSVDYDDTNVKMVFQDSGTEITDSCRQLSRGREGLADVEALPVSEHCLYYALMLLLEYGVQVEMEARQGRNVISLRAPYRL